MDFHYRIFTLLLYKYVCYCFPKKMLTRFFTFHIVNFFYQLKSLSFFIMQNFTEYCITHVWRIQIAQIMNKHFEPWQNETISGYNSIKISLWHLIPIFSCFLLVFIFYSYLFDATIYSSLNSMRQHNKQTKKKIKLIQLNSWGWRIINLLTHNLAAEKSPT